MATKNNRNQSSCKEQNERKINMKRPSLKKCREVVSSHKKEILFTSCGLIIGVVVGGKHIKFIKSRKMNIPKDVIVVPIAKMMNRENFEKLRKYAKNDPVLLVVKDLAKDRIINIISDKQKTPASSEENIMESFCDDSDTIIYDEEAEYDDDSERLSIWDASDIWWSSGEDEDYTFGYSEEELRKAVA